MKQLIVSNVDINIWKIYISAYSYTSYLLLDQNFCVWRSMFDSNIILAITIPQVTKVTDSSEILEKFPRIGPKMRDFCGITVLRLSIEKFLRNSPECFSGNSWEILKTWSPSLHIFRELDKRIGFKKFLRTSQEFFSRNS